MNATDALACPKCGKKRVADSEACPRCGLLFALWKPDDVPLATPLDERGQEIWQSLLSSWQTPGRHEEFLKHCLQTNTLAAAGRLYRQRLDDDPEDAMAAHMQTQLLAKATLNLNLYKSQPREAMTRSRWFWAVVLLAMGLGIVGGLFWRRFR